MDREYSVYLQKKVRLQWTNIAEQRFLSLVPSQPVMLWILMADDFKCRTSCSLVTENDGCENMQLPLCPLIKLLCWNFMYFPSAFWIKILLENCSWRSLVSSSLYSDKLVMLIVFGLWSLERYCTDTSCFLLLSK